MKKYISKLLIVAAIFLISLGIYSNYFSHNKNIVHAQALDSLQTSGLRFFDGFAWSSNIGWVHFKGTATNGTTYGVTVDAATGAMYGNAWSTNLGWLSFDSSLTASCGSNVTYDKNAGTFSGYAKFVSVDAAPGNTGDWTGCVKFSGNTKSGSSYGVTAVEGTTQAVLSNTAWGSEVVGWLKMSGNGYAVTITDTATPPPSCLPPSTLIEGKGANAGLCQCPPPGNEVIAPGASCPGPTSAPVISASSGAGCNQINITWSVVPGADHYILYESTSANSGFTQVANNIAGNITSYNRTTAIVGTAYYKLVASADSSNTVLSPDSNVASAQVPTTGCVVPPSSSIGTFVGSPTSIAKGSACTLNWTGVSGNTSCKIYRSSIGGIAVFTVPAVKGQAQDGSTVIDPSLQATTRYWLQCEADSATFPPVFSQQQTQCTLAPKYDEF